MRLVHNLNKSGLDQSKKIYECNTCNRLFNWGKGSEWYGSHKLLEEKPEKIKYFCSSKCKEKHNE